MPRRATYVPKHRDAPVEPTPQKSLRKSVMFSGVAVAATGIAVTGGVFVKDSAPADTATRAASAISAAQADRQDQPPAEVTRDSGTEASRSDRRTALDETKQGADQDPGGQAATATSRTTRSWTASRRTTASQTTASRTAQSRTAPSPTTQDPRSIARAMLPEFGFSDSEFGCLDSLYVSESDWDMHADNPASSAYGIPQALTGGTHDLPADYMTNPASQIRWGLEYIRDSYGTPCGAWEFKQSHEWY